MPHGCMLIAVAWSHSFTNDINNDPEIITIIRSQEAGWWGGGVVG